MARSTEIQGISENLKPGWPENSASYRDGPEAVPTGINRGSGSLVSRRRLPTPEGIICIKFLLRLSKTTTSSVLRICRSPICLKTERSLRQYPKCLGLNSGLCLNIKLGGKASKLSLLPKTLPQ